jgi:hypothetical protein
MSRRERMNCFIRVKGSKGFSMRAKRDRKAPAAVAEKFLPGAQNNNKKFVIFKKYVMI